MNKFPILLVEDDVDIQENLRQFLVDLEGFEVHSVFNGREALDFLKKTESAYIVLLDLMMPVMNGYEFLEEFFSSKEFDSLKRNKVIVLSATPDSDKTARTWNVDFIKKPINLDHLLSAISRKS